MKQLNICLCGLGTVGGAIFSALCDTERRRLLEQRAQTRLSLHTVSARRARDYPVHDYRYTTDVLEAAQRPDVDVVMEAIGGVDTALELARVAISNKKHLITANKDLLARHGSKLFADADRQDTAILWEAAVGGAVPVVQVLSNSMLANRIRRIEGIINGTSNYVMSAMSEHGQDFDVALRTAQELGYAEEDPGFDIDGVDAAHKILLLAGLAWGVPLEGIAAVACQSISEVKPVDLSCADEFDYVIKPLAIAELSDENTATLRVAPTLLPRQSTLATVRGSNNCVSILGDMADKTLLVGKGAGGAATCSAMLADLISLARGKGGGTMKTAQGQGATCTPQGHDEYVCPHYLRCSVADQPKVLSNITRRIGEHDINVARVWQQKRPGQSTDPHASRDADESPDGREPDTTVVALITEACEERRIAALLDELHEQPFMREAPVHLHVRENDD